MVERNETALHEEELLSEPLSQLQWKVRPPVFEFPANLLKGAIENLNYWAMHTVRLKLLLTLLLGTAHVIKGSSYGRGKGFLNMKLGYPAYLWGSRAAVHQSVKNNRNFQNTFSTTIWASL